MKALVHLLQASLPGTAAVPGLSAGRGREFLARFHREAPWTVVVALWASAVATWLLPPVTIGRLRPACWLRAADLDRHLAAMARHPLYLVRQSLMMIKSTAGLAWGADPTVRRALGYEAYGPDPATWRES